MDNTLLVLGLSRAHLNYSLALVDSTKLLQSSYRVLRNPGLLTASTEAFAPAGLDVQPRPTLSSSLCRQDYPEGFPSESPGDHFTVAVTPVTEIISLCRGVVCVASSSMSTTFNTWTLESPSESLFRCATEALPRQSLWRDLGHSLLRFEGEHVMLHEDELENF